MHAFILAGGFATRLWPLTEKRPKPLLPLAGRPLLTHLLEKIPTSIPVTVSTNAAFREVFTQWKSVLSGRDVEVIVEDAAGEEQKLGAIGAVAQWAEKRHVEDDILLLTGDNYFGFPLGEMIQQRKNSRPLLAVYDIGEREKARAFGTVLLKSPMHSSLPSAEILAFEEKPPDPRSSLVSTGCSVLPREVLPLLREFSKRQRDNIGSFFEEMLRQGIGIDAFPFAGPWLDIGSFHSYLDAHRLLVGTQTILDPAARMTETACSGGVVVGRGSGVEGSVLEDAIVFDDCIIRNCTIRHCIIDDRCILENIDLSGKMLRAGTVLRLP